jgi:energy-coupling factor transporter ATP-binding protein EcfA2
MSDDLIADEYEAANIMDNFARQCLGEPGQHVLIVGYTGSGKTTTMFWIYKAMGLYGKDTRVWIDSMKSEEALTLLTMGPVRFLIPAGCKLDIKFNPNYKGPELHPFEVVEMPDYMNPWKYLRADWSNVICLSAYLIDPAAYAAVMAAVFTNLIWSAHRKKIITPMALFVDEIHNIAPSNGHSYDRVHTKAGLVVQHNVERLRSMGIRVIGSTQGNSKLRRGVRSCFNWLIVKRGSNFDRREEFTLNNFNKKWAKLKNLQITIVFPNRTFSKLITIDYFPRGCWNNMYPDGIGSMDYDGEKDPNEEKRQQREAAKC